MRRLLLQVGKFKRDQLRRCISGTNFANLLILQKFYLVSDRGFQIADLRQAIVRHKCYYGLVQRQQQRCRLGRFQFSLAEARGNSLGLHFPNMGLISSELRSESRRKGFTCIRHSLSLKTTASRGGGRSFLEISKTSGVVDITEGGSLVSRNEMRGREHAHLAV